MSAAGREMVSHLRRLAGIALWRRRRNVPRGLRADVLEVVGRRAAVEARVEAITDELGLIETAVCEALGRHGALRVLRAARGVGITLENIWLPPSVRLSVRAEGPSLAAAAGEMAATLRQIEAWAAATRRDLAVALESVGAPAAGA